MAWIMAMVFWSMIETRYQVRALIGLVGGADVFENSWSQRML